MEPTAQDLARIAAGEIFAGTDPGLLDLPGQAWSLAEYDRGQVLYDPAHFRRCLGFVLLGRVQVGKPTDDGRGLAISILEAGSMFGAAALFHEQPVYATELTALEPCRVAYLTQAGLLELMRADFRIGENYIRYLSGRILFLNGRIAQLTAGSAELRLARCLLESAVRDDGGRLWAEPGSMTTLASRLNIGRASLYRALDALEAAGSIARTGRRIELLNVELLKGAP